MYKGCQQNQWDLPQKIDIILNCCEWMQKYGSKCLLMMFCDTQWCIGGLKITTEKGSSGSVDPQPYSSRPHTARTAAKINNVKDFAVIILISV